MGFCICKGNAVLLFVVGVAFLALEALFITSKVGSHEAVVKVLFSKEGSSVLLALCDPVYFLIVFLFVTYNVVLS